MTDRDPEDIAATIASFLRGDSQVYNAVSRRVKLYIEGHRPNSAIDRDELHSEILMAILTNLRRDRFRGNSLKEFNAYVYSIVRNHVARSFKQSRHAVPFDELQQLQSNVRAIGDRVADQELTQQIFAALDPRCRRLLKLKFVFEWTDQEIADFMKKTKNATSTSISRCLKKAQQLPFMKEIL